MLRSRKFTVGGIGGKMGMYERKKRKFWHRCG